MNIELLIFLSTLIEYQNDLCWSADFFKYVKGPPKCFSLHVYIKVIQKRIPSMKRSGKEYPDKQLVRGTGQFAQMIYLTVPVIERQNVWQPQVRYEVTSVTCVYYLFFHKAKLLQAPPQWRKLGFLMFYVLLYILELYHVFNIYLPILIYCLGIQIL